MYYIRNDIKPIIKNLLFEAFDKEEKRLNRIYDRNDPDDVSMFDDVDNYKKIFNIISSQDDGLTYSQISDIRDLLSEYIEDESWYSGSGK